MDEIINVTCTLNQGGDVEFAIANPLFDDEEQPTPILIQIFGEG